jgi:hypothetical protein
MNTRKINLSSKIIPAQPNTKKVAGTDVPNNKKVKVMKKRNSSTQKTYLRQKSTSSFKPCKR